MKYLNRVLLALLLIFEVNSLHASSIDDDTLEIYSKILPRLIFMSSQKEKIDKSLQICILRDDIDENSALTLIEKVTSHYPKGIKKYNIEFVQSNYTNVTLCKQTQLAFMFTSDHKSFSDAIKSLNNYKVITMSYDPKWLEYGVETSLFIGRRVMPYLNMKALQKNGIEFDNILLRVSKIYQEGVQ
ncbi:MAG: DUF4154 domain-containing protein [Helicobacteraceae bacterium]|nr:DUF4154 domain-containing protein [Helicobacteraceae bacterium]